MQPSVSYFSLGRYFRCPVPWGASGCAGVGLPELLFTLSDMEMCFEKALPVGQRSMGCKMGADVLDDISSSLPD